MSYICQLKVLWSQIFVEYSAVLVHVDHVFDIVDIFSLIVDI